VTAFRLLLALAAIATTLPAQDPTEPGDALFKNGEEAYRFAEGYYRRHHYDRAAAQFEQVVQTFPEFDKRDKACFLWAESLRLGKKFDLAGRVYVTVVQSFPESEYAPRSSVVLGSLLLKEGKVDDAIVVLDMGMELKPPEQYREDLNYFLGVAKHRKGEVAAALKHFALLPGEFDAEHAYRAHARLNTGYLQRSAGKDDEAKTAFASLIKDDGVAPKVIEEALSQLADIAFAASDHEEAVRYYRQQLDAYPLGAFANRGMVELSWSLYHLERYQEVIELLKDQANISTEDTLYLLGSSSKQLGQYEAAIARFQEMQKAYPDGRLGKLAKFDLIECAFRLKRFEEAIAKAKQFLEQHANHKQASDAAYFLAHSLTEAGQLDEAASQFETLYERYGDTWEYREDTLFILADIYSKLNRPEDSAAALRRVMAVDSSKQRDRALLLAAEAAQNAANLDAAIADYRRFLKEFPKSELLPTAMLQLADLLMRREDKSAAEVLTSFLEAFPEHAFVPRAYYLRGNLQYNENQFATGISDFRRAIDYPNFPERDFAQLMLAYSLWELGIRNDSPDAGKEALKIFAELIEIESLSQDFVPELLQVIGEKYVELNNLGAAERCFDMLSAHENEQIALQGLLGKGKIAFGREQFDDARVAFNEVRTRAADDRELLSEAISYLGETLRRQSRISEAHVVLRDGLDLDIRNTTTKSRLLLSLAHVLLAENDEERAVDYASSVYFVYHDPVMAPEAMLLTLSIQLRRGEHKEACAVVAELTDRFPGAWASFQNRPDNAQLVEQIQTACEKPAAPTP